MRVRTQSEIQSLDDELHLFEEAEWDFMSIVDTQGSNYEYFNDIRDADFDLHKTKKSEILIYLACFMSIMACMLVVAFKVTNFFDDSEWRELNSIQSIQGGTSMTYVQGGDEATPEELIAVSNTLSSYVNCVQARGDYYRLGDICIDGSKFSDKYYEAVNDMVTIYDINDCYARGLREFAGCYRVQRINNVIKKGDVYYCYASVSYPTIYDVSEYINMNSQSFVLKFQGGYNITEATVAKFLLEVIDESPVSSTVNEVCIQMKDVDGYFKIVDDSWMLSMASDDYSVAVSQLLKILEGSLTG